MRRGVLLMIAAVLLAYPCALMAQHGGGRGGHGGAGGAPAAGTGADTSVSGLEQAVAVQATESQRALFQRAATSVEVARKLAEDLAQDSVKTTPLPNLAGTAEALMNAVDVVHHTNEVFVQGLSKTQISELKSLIKKVSKAGEDVEAKWKATNRELTSPKVSGPKLSETAGKLTQALTSLRAQQKALGNEMGIQG